ncbi:MAG: response regulator [Elusimicrobiales bacterium]|nr:response regulator [Elusimicrobiales bacterium]
MQNLIIASLLTAAAAALFLAYRRGPRAGTGLFEHMREPVFVTAPDCSIVYANKAAHEALGVKKGSLSGLKCYQAAHGLDKPLPQCANMMAGGCADPLCLEHFSKKLGRDLRISVFPVMGKSGGVDRVICIAQDAAPGRTRETRRHHDAQMEAMSRLAGAVAHQFNNILSVIGAALHLAKTSGNAEDRAGALAAIESSVGNGAGITRQLLTLSRSNAIHKTVVDPGALLLETLKILSSHPDVPAIDARLRDGLPPVQADPLELSRLFQHVLGNKEFLSASGEPVIVEASSASLARPDMDDAPGTLFLKVSIRRLCRDFDRTSIKDIFEPGLETSRWTLPIAYAIAKKHGGWIEASYSWVGVLAFDIYLSAGTAESAPAKEVPAPRPESAAAKGPLRVLLAEDDEDLRRMTVRMLRAEGHSVAEAADGLEAERLMAGGGFDALLSDTMMPGRTGIELAERARAGAPGIRVILMSGHSEGRMDPARAADLGYIFIQKPYSADRLLGLLKN